MVTEVNTSQVSPNDGTADSTPGTVMLSPQVVVERLRELQRQIPDIAPLTKEERKAMRKLAATPAKVVQASIMVIGASDIVEQGSVSRRPACGNWSRLQVTGAWSS